MTIEECRRFYAEEIHFAAGLQSPSLVEAFASVPREKYLGPGPWEIGSPEARGMSAMGLGQMSYITVDDPRQLYHNVVVAIDRSSDINNGQPSSLARWIDALSLSPGERAYHLGCGVGYYTAILAELTGTGGSVVATDVSPALAARATQNFSACPNVAVHARDGAIFDPGPCDAMLINAGMTHPLPHLLDRLGEGGRMIVPLTMSISAHLGAGVMTKIVRRSSGFSAEIVTPVAIYSCTSARDAEREPLLRAAMTGGRLNQMRSVRRDPHEAVDTCLVHGSDRICLSTAPVPE
jgi:protein-L-isoaspartate(D-aspartate) O-methyltransferase